MTQKEEIDVLKLAFDSRQKELEGRLTLMSSVATTLGLSIAGVFFTFKDRMHPTLAIGLGLTLVAFVGSLTLWFYSNVEDMSREVAQVEAAINRIADKKLLTYEQTLTKSRRSRPWRHFLRTIVAVVFYLGLQYVFYLEFREFMFPSEWGKIHDSLAVVYRIFVFLPVCTAAVSLLRLYQGRTQSEEALSCRELLQAEGGTQVNT